MSRPYDLIGKYITVFMMNFNLRIVFGLVSENRTYFPLLVENRVLVLVKSRFILGEDYTP